MTMKKKTGSVDCRIADIRSGTYTQSQLVNAVRESGKPLSQTLDRVSLSKAEHGVIILIPQHVEAIAEVLGCKCFDLYPDLY